MPAENKMQTENLSSLSIMRRKASHVRRTFFLKLKHDSSELIIENEWRFKIAVITAEKAFKSRETVPVSEDGLPYLYHLSSRILSTEKGVITQKRITEILHTAGEKHRFYDAELFLLPSFLTVAAAELYVKEKKLRYAEAILHLSDVDFTAIFFAFSEVEKLFLQENKEIYRNCDIATRNLYHARLTAAAKKAKEDPFIVAQKIVEDANRQETHIGAVLRADRGILPKLYFYFLSVLCLLLTGLVGVWNGAGYWNLLLLPMLFFSIYGFTKVLLEPFFAIHGEKILPKLVRGEAVEKTKVLVSVATFLFGKEKDEKIFDKIEDFYLTNHERTENVVFAVVGDLPQSEKRTTDQDAEILAYAEKRIRALCAKYGEHFALFIRGRRHSVSENAYIGWERKRGSVLELCRFLRGKETSFILRICDTQFLSEVKYLITLDADTNLYAGAVRDLVGTMLHPENTPKTDDKGTCVVSGHAVIQPRMTTTLHSASITAFADMTGGAGGIDIYASAGSDFYQNLFDEGIFCGKGILDVDMFLAVCDGFFPCERILSHDLAEGNLLRSALSTQIVLSDGTPKNAISYYIREHRWLRGDLQIAPYLLPYVKNQKGEKIRNPMSWLSKYKILDNLLRAATPFCSLTALLISMILGGKAAAWSTLAVFSSVLFSVVRTAVTGVRHHGMAALFRALSVAFFRVSGVVHEAYLFADACIRTVYRFAVSRKNFLNWTTASAGDSAKRGYLDDYILRFSPSMLVGLIFFCIPGVFSRILGLIWMGMPFAFWILSKEKKENSRLCARDRETIMRYTHDAWLYFRDYVNETTHGLPPDNVQISPVYAVAKRTSPTNIGLYLLSLLAARDFGYIKSTELYDRSYLTACTVSALFKWNGHLYNWYDLETLEVLGEPFVSAVDSGNFITSLVSFCEGAKEYAGEDPRLLDVIAIFDRVIAETDFRTLYDESRRLFYVGYHVKNGTFSTSHYDTFMSESRLTSYYAVATRAVPREHYFTPARHVIGRFGDYGIASWSGTAFEYFMPALLLPTEKHSLTAAALSYAFRTQCRKTMKKHVLGKRRCVFGTSESGYFAFDGEMNYQYHAFGTERLSLDPAVRAEAVVAPYASFLMLEENPDRVTENLAELEALGMYGKYGFYEALDLDASRVGGGYAKVQSFMSHHVGMSIVSAANLVNNGIFRKRFLKNPAMRASRELLCEKMPTVLLPYTVKKHVVKEDLPIRIESVKEENIPGYTYTLLHPDVAMVTNNKTKIFASSSGHIEIQNGADAVCISDYDPYELGGGFRVYVNIDGTVFPTVPLMAEADGFASRFSFVSRPDSIEYRSHHISRQHTYEISLKFSVLPDREFCEIICEVRGVFKTAHAMMYFEPILTEKRQYLFHKSFSGLFLESEYHSDEDAVLWRRRPRSDNMRETLLGVKVSPCPQTRFFDTMRDQLLPLMAVESDYAALAEREKFSDSSGAVILPACAVKSGEIGMKKEKITFIIGAAEDVDDLLYELAGGSSDSRKLRRLKMGDLLNLQYSAAGLSRSVGPLEHFLLRSMMFGQIRPRAENYRFLDKNAFWRFSISGENPIVLAKNLGNDMQMRFRLRELIGLFKYLCIRGVRYDFVIFYRETDDYNRVEYEKLMYEIRRAGCENFVSWSCGIYLVNESVLTAEERFAYMLSAAAVFDLFRPLFETAGENSHTVSLSAEIERMMKKEISSYPREAKMPSVSTVRSLKSGIFHKDGFLVKKPHGTAPFAHVLASENFGTVVTENSLGFTYVGNAGLKKLTPHTADGMKEDKGERIILRVYDMYDVKNYRDFDLCASAAWVNYLFGKVIYSGSVGIVRFSVEVLLLGNADVKIMSVTLECDEKIRVALIYTVSPALGERADAGRFYHFRKESDAIRIFRYSENGMKGGEAVIFSPDATSFYTDMAAFRSDGAVFRGEADAAILVCRTELHGKRTINFYLAAIFSEKQYASIRAQCAKGDFEAENTTMPYSISVKTAEPLLDEMVNKWTLYQTLFSRIRARSGFYQVSGAYGFRDQLQDSLALILTAPNVTKTIIFRAAAHQYEEGDVQHFWHPEGAGLRTRCSDDYLWLPFVAAEYIRMTGDDSILNAKIAYLSSPVLAAAEGDRYELPMKTDYQESLWEHMKRAVAHANAFGAHGLPLIGACDWNDGMNLVGKEGKGESVWLAFFLLLVWERMAKLSEKLGENSICFREKQQKLMAALREYGFDGEWYRRGYYDDGSILGGSSRGDCKIDVIAQAFAGIAAEELDFEKERAAVSMASAEAYLFDRKHRLVKLLSPPFDQDLQSPGYIKGYVPGIRENGGQYTHAAVWSALGFFGCKKSALGAEILFSINPAMRAENAELEKSYRIEPYVFAGDVYTNPAHMGRGGWSWYTGSAAWYRRAVIEWLCGYREDGDGFYISPHLSEMFSSFTLSVNKKDTQYQIEVSLGDKTLRLLDGKPIAEDHRFLFDGGVHEVQILFLPKENE